MSNSWKEDPPVIVGMACRLPGNVNSAEELWQMVAEQRSAQGPVPANRYNIDGFYHPYKDRSGSTNVPGGYFINEDVRLFDNNFFGINNLEATYMDPQQRKLLEVTFEAFQNAGTTMKSVNGSSTGVFVGNFSVDYQPGQTRDTDYIHRYTATGSGATVMSNRISHVFNLLGPSCTIDTACSSSIYALHQALNAMRAGDCEGAVVASANLILSPELHIGAAKSGVLSPTGECHTFDASADGYGRAEGVNAIYIKRLSAALRDNNPIRAIIRGSAVNASGRTPGISLPSGEMQQIVMAKAYENAGISAQDTDYVECHGTGTPVGDPIEVDAIGRFFKKRSGPELLIGSVKTNVGHSEAASGITSIIKVTKAFENGVIPPTYGVKKLNPKLKLVENNIKIATSISEWPQALRRASINSFGYGGANAHIILESPDLLLAQHNVVLASLNGMETNGINGTSNEKVAASQETRAFTLPVSASSANAAEILTSRVTDSVSLCNSLSELNEVVTTLTDCRDALRYRSYLTASYDEALGITITNDAAAPATVGDCHPFAFVFTGQGAQYANMGKELLQQNKGFRNTIRALDHALQSLPAPYAPEWTLEQTILDDANVSKINEVTRSQPICTAIQVALVNMLQSWGIKPSSVVGHSSGEIGAAYAAGLLSASQAILVAYYRGYAVDTLKSKGAMMAAGVSDVDGRAMIEQLNLQTEIRVACVNAPASVTLSGTVPGINAALAELEKQGKFTRKLQTGDRAYHSHMMAEVGQLYEELLDTVFQSSKATVASLEQNAVTMFSSVGSDPSARSKINGSKYWRQNLEQSVEFNSALSELIKTNGKCFLIELGPHSALKGPIEQIRKANKVDANAVPYASTLVRKENSNVVIQSLAGKLFKAGFDLDWSIVNSQLPSRTSAKKSKANPIETVRPNPTLAPYPWDYSIGLLWSEPRAAVELRNRAHVRHELLGSAALAGNGTDLAWRNILKPSEMAWFNDHKLEEQVVFPAAGYIAVAIEAISQATGIKNELRHQMSQDYGFQLRNINVATALTVPAENDPAASDLELHTTLSPRKISGVRSSEDWYEFAISSLAWTSGESTLHCSGSIRLVAPDKASANIETVTVENAQGFDKWATANRFYEKWAEEGLCFGPQFKSITGLQTDSARLRREAIASAFLEPVESEGPFEYYPVHPITIDAAIQAACLSGTRGKVSSLKAWLPVFISNCYVQPSTRAQSGVEASIHVKSEEMGFASRRIDATMWDDSGAPVVSFSDGRIALYNGKKIEAASSGNEATEKFLERQPTLRVQWQPDISRLSTDAAQSLNSYVSKAIAKQSEDLQDDISLATIGILLKLAGHKNPRMRVLELNGDSQGYKASTWMSMLDKDTAFPRCQSWNVANIDEEGTLTFKDDAEGPFDVILAPRHASFKCEEDAVDAVLTLLSDRGVVVARNSECLSRVLERAGFTTFEVGSNGVVLATRPLPVTQLLGRKAVVLTSDNASESVSKLATALTDHLKAEVDISSTCIIKLGNISEVELNEQDICVSLIELEQELLATLSPDTMDQLRAVTDNVTDLLWLTGSNMLGSQPNPNLTLSSGLSRAVMLEQPTLRWSILDIGSDFAKLSDSPADIRRICKDAVSALVTGYDKDDCEFIVADGLVQVSRYGPDWNVNSVFRQTLQAEDAATETKLPLADIGSARLSIARPGATDTMFFQQLGKSENSSPIPVGYVEISVKTVSLNAKDVYAMNGRVETKDVTTGFDFSGVITSVNQANNGLKVGDEVVACAPFHIGTTARVPSGCVHKLNKGESNVEVPTLLLAYATALYALEERARLQPKETVLIHAGSGGVGIAAITIARNAGATVFATCGSDAKRNYLINELGLEPAHVFSSRDDSFVQGILDATNNCGVDVLLNSLVGDLMHEGWQRCMADFGRFVEIGKRELLDVGRLDMRVFLRNVTFTAFDLSDLYHSNDTAQQATWN